jgi:hypothetical protein
LDEHVVPGKRHLILGFDLPVQAQQNVAVGSHVEARNDPRDRSQVEDKSADVEEPHRCLGLLRSLDRESFSLKLPNSKGKIELGGAWRL